MENPRDLLLALLETYKRQREALDANIRDVERMLALDGVGPTSVASIEDAIVLYVDQHGLEVVHAHKLAPHVAAMGCLAGDGRRLSDMSESAQKRSITNTLARSTDSRLKYDRKTRLVTRIP